MTEPSKTDISAMFWSFVHAVTDMPYDDLTATPEFAWLSDTTDEARGIMVLSEEVAGVPSACVTSTEFDELAVRGVTWDADERNYEFQDTNALFIGLLDMLKAHRDVIDYTRLDALESCVNKMLRTISVDELADELCASALCT